jgi:Ca2+-binding EF-hand superfamily protein
MTRYIALFCALSLASGFAAAGDDATKKTDPAAASTEHQREAVGFDVLDADGDDRISKEEANKVAAIAGDFSTADGDQDGYLSRSEFEEAGWEKSDETG